MKYESPHKSYQNEMLTYNQGQVRPIEHGYSQQERVEVRRMENYPEAPRYYE